MGSLDSATTIIEKLRSAGYIALLNGGCVRDRLLGIEPKDYDVATDAPPEQVRRLFRRTKAVGAQFGVVLVRIDGVDTEVATFRSDMAYHDGRRPSAVEFTTPERDAQRRDFTINGMFYDPVTDVVVDYVGGRQDLDARLVRCIGRPQERFTEDHLRMLRAIRFAARLDFEIEPDTFAAIRQCAPQLRRIAPERIRMELELILESPSRGRGWRLMVEAGLADYLLPYRVWSPDELSRVASILAALPPTASPLAGFAAAFSGLAPPDAERACRELRCSNVDTQAVGQLVVAVAPLLAGDTLELADVKNLLATGLFAEMTALARAVAVADHVAPDQLERVVQRAASIPEEAVAPPPLLTGDDLLAMNLTPSPLFGRVLADTYRAQLNERITTRPQALEMAQQQIAKERETT